MIPNFRLIVDQIQNVTVTKNLMQHYQIINLLIFAILLGILMSNTLVMIELSFLCIIGINKP